MQTPTRTPLSSSILKLALSWNRENSAKPLSKLQVGKPVRLVYSSVYHDRPSNHRPLVDHVQITALSRALQTNVKIAYLDGRSEKAEFVDFTNAVEPEMAPIHLLYRCVLLVTADNSQS